MVQALTLMILMMVVVVMLPQNLRPYILSEWEFQRIHGPESNLTFLVVFYTEIYMNLPPTALCNFKIAIIAPSVDRSASCE